MHECFDLSNWVTEFPLNFIMIQLESRKTHEYISRENIRLYTAITEPSIESTNPILVTKD